MSASSLVEQPPGQPIWGLCLLFCLCLCVYIHNVRGYSSVTHAVALRVAKQREPLVMGSSSQLQSGARQDGPVRLYLTSKKLKCVLGCLIVVSNPYDYRSCVNIGSFPSLVVMVGEGDFILEFCCQSAALCTC